MMNKEILEVLKKWRANEWVRYIIYIFSIGVLQFLVSSKRTWIINNDTLDFIHQFIEYSSEFIERLDIDW